MKHIFLVCVSFVLTTPALCASVEHTHEHVSLDGDWNFTYTGASTAKVPELPSTSAYDASIRVPGRWDEQLDRFKNSQWWAHAIFQTSLGPVQYLSGVGWHRRLFDVPAAWAGRTITLTIGSAVGTTHVWINGKYLGKNEIGVYTPFKLDVSSELVADKPNEILIAIDNASANPFGGWALMGNSGSATGLARSVTLDVSAGAGSINDVFIRPGDQLNDVVWNVELKSAAVSSLPAGSKIEWSVRDAANHRELAHGQQTFANSSKSNVVKWMSHINDIKPWSDREPNLYVAELKWKSPNGELIDSRIQRFGLRRYSYEGRKLFLNGNPLYLRLEFGAYYFARDGAVSMSKDYWLAHMRRTKELGFNGINFAAQVCPIEMLEAADELGLILQCGDQETTRPETKNLYQEVWNSIVRTTRSHPSTAIYGFGGELEYYDGVIEQYGAQRELIKQLNPESLVMPQQAIHGIDYGLSNRDPGFVSEPFPHNAERLKRYTEACDLFGHYSGGAFSHRYFDTPWRVMENRFKIYTKPLVAHELFLSASYLNPENAAKYTGRIPPYIYTRLEQDLKEAGFADKWPIYFDHTSRVQSICRKYCIEKARKCDELAGYELLGMSDMHFITPEYAVGMLDEFFDLKPGETIEGIRRYNDESILLLEFDKGDQCVQLLISRRKGRRKVSRRDHGFDLWADTDQARQTELATDARRRDVPRRVDEYREHP